jgi:hypothetical protein
MHGNVLKKREFQALSILVADFDYLWICVQIDIFAYPQGKSLLSIYLLNDGSSNSGVEGSCFLVMISWYCGSVYGQIIQCHDALRLDKLPHMQYDLMEM